jgi:hypothetical protein
MTLFVLVPNIWVKYLAKQYQNPQHKFRQIWCLVMNISDVCQRRLFDGKYIKKRSDEYFSIVSNRVILPLETLRKTFGNLESIYAKHNLNSLKKHIFNSKLTFSKGSNLDLIVSSCALSSFSCCT